VPLLNVHKTTCHEIEECRKREYNNMRNNSSGNLRNLLRPMDGPRAGTSNVRPVKAIENREIEPKEEHTES